MYSALIERKRYERLPEDSGEWAAVPVVPRRIPVPSVPTPRALVLWANLLPLFQFVLGLGFFMLLWLVPDPPKLGWWVLLSPLIIGFFTTLVAGIQASANGGPGVWRTLGVMLRGQVWWAVLMLIPIYGWFVLAVCVPPCVVGSLLGAALAGVIMKTETQPWTP